MLTDESCNPPFAADKRLHELEILAVRNRRKLFGRLKFPADLEDAFDVATSRSKAKRMWRDGLLTVVVWTVCLGMDFWFVKALAWRAVLLKIAATIPVALAATEVERRNPKTMIREGTVVASITLVSAIIGVSLVPLGAVGYAYAQFACVVCASFAVLVKRVRFIYALWTVALSAFQVIGFAMSCGSVDPFTRLFGFSIAVMAMGTLVAIAFWIESEERLLFLFMTQAKSRQRELRKANSELARSSETDFLTGLMNRRALMRRMEAVWSNAERRQQRVAIVMVDIDCFKQINDTYGHGYGDLALTRVATLMASCLRGPCDIAARYGGEEFLVFLPNTPFEHAEIVAERVRSLVENAGAPPPQEVGGAHPSGLTVSCGVAGCTLPSDVSLTELCETADKAMYQAKMEGRNRVRSLEARVGEVTSPATSSDAERNRTVAQQVRMS